MVVTGRGFGNAPGGPSEQRTQRSRFETSSFPWIWRCKERCSRIVVFFSRVHGAARGSLLLACQRVESSFRSDRNEHSSMETVWPVTRCVRCGAPTNLFRADIPYCVKCVDRIETSPTKSPTSYSETVVDRADWELVLMIVIVAAVVSYLLIARG
jgi:hypothetical protein